MKFKCKLSLTFALALLFLVTTARHAQSQPVKDGAAGISPTGDISLLPDIAEILHLAGKSDPAAALRDAHAKLRSPVAERNPALDRLSAAIVEDADLLKVERTIASEIGISRSSPLAAKGLTYGSASTLSELARALDHRSRDTGMDRKLRSNSARAALVIAAMDEFTFGPVLGLQFLKDLDGWAERVKIDPAVAVKLRERFQTAHDSKDRSFKVMAPIYRLVDRVGVAPAAVKSRTVRDACDALFRLSQTELDSRLLRWNWVHTSWHLLNHARAAQLREEQQHLETQLRERRAAVADPVMRSWIDEALKIESKPAQMLVEERVEGDKIIRMQETYNDGNWSVVEVTVQDGQ